MAHIRSTQQMDRNRLIHEVGLVYSLRFHDNRRPTFTQLFEKTIEELDFDYEIHPEDIERISEAVLTYGRRYIFKIQD